MNPKIPQFYLSYTPCDRTIWGLSRSPDGAKADGEKYINEYRGYYPRELRNAKIEVVKCEKKIYDIIMQYGYWEERHKWKLVNGAAELVK